jgi:hypothetical protein
MDPSWKSPALLPAAALAQPKSMITYPDGKSIVGFAISANYVMAADRRPKALALTGSDYAFVRLLGDSIVGTVVEFHNSILDHYFVTASSIEAAAIDGGSAGPGWSRTGLTFKSGGINRACRFYGTPGVGPNSHFYTLDPAECAQVRRDPGWHFESYDFSSNPPGPGGVCAAGTVPVYRAYNHRFAQNDSNHRLTTNLTAYNAQVALGWTGEGVVMCAPA